jgi:geranylgeranyl diphosphate synthase type I
METVGEEMAEHGGLSMAILAGDCQHGLVVNCLADLSKPPFEYPPELVIDLINYIETDVLNTLIVGEADDVIYSRTPIGNLSINKIETMLFRKTAKLFEFCVAAGASLAQNKWNPRNKYQSSLTKFAGNIGLAFQLQDDLLGITGDESKLGKPVGSDIQEGKRTTLVLHAYENGTDIDRRFLENSLGSKDFSDTKSIIELFERTGSIDYLKKRTSVLYNKAVSSLSILEDSIYKTWLIELAEKMVCRES